MGDTRTGCLSGCPPRSWTRKHFVPMYAAPMRLILLLSALLSAIAGYSPAAATRPVVAGQIECVTRPLAANVAARPANRPTPAASFARVEAAPRAANRPLYADRLLI